MPQEAEDQPRGHAKLRLRVGKGVVNAPDDHLEGDAPVGVGLRIEENFRMPDAVLLRPLQVRPRQVIKILLGLQHTGPGVVDVEEGLQVAEGIRRPHFLHVRVGQRNAVALGQLEQQFRLQRPLDVQVQLRFGQSGNEVFVSHGWSSTQCESSMLLT